MRMWSNLESGIVPQLADRYRCFVIEHRPSIGTTPRTTTTHILLHSTFCAATNTAWHSSPIRSLVTEDVSIAACARATRGHKFVSGLGKHEVVATCNWKRTVCPWDLSARSNQQFLELACTGRCICPFISLRSTISILPVCGVYAAATFANKIETCNVQLIGLCQNPQLLNTDFCDTALLEEGFSVEHQHNICLHSSVATCAG